MGLNGNVGNKNSGRKTDAEIIAKAINTGLANEIGNEELKRIKKTKVDLRWHKDLTEIVMPIVLKGITERKELTGKDGQPLFLPSEVMEKYNLNDKGTDKKPKPNS